MGGASGVPTPPSPLTDEAGLKEWVQKHLEALRRTLTRLARKAAAALLGIISSIISWLLMLLAKMTSWLAKNVWVVLIAIGGVLLLTARGFILSALVNLLSVS